MVEVIDLRGAGKTYRTGTLEYEALHGIDLEIHEDEVARRARRVVWVRDGQIHTDEVNDR